MLKKLFLIAALISMSSVTHAGGLPIINPATFGVTPTNIAAQIQLATLQAKLAELKKQGIPQSEPMQIADAKTDEFCMYAGVLYSKGAVLPIEGHSPLICQKNIHSSGGMNDPLVWVKLDDWNRAISGDSSK